MNEEIMRAPAASAPALSIASSAALGFQSGASSTTMNGMPRASRLPIKAPVAHACDGVLAQSR
jgi:hypothetical protein